MVAAMRKSCLPLVGVVGSMAALVGCASVAPAPSSPPSVDRMSAFLAERGWSPSAAQAATDPVGPMAKGDGGELVPPPPSAAPPAAPEAAAQAVVTAMSFLGVNYRRGGTSSEEGFDCSGFARHVFDTALGIELPRRAEEQARAPGLVPVPRHDLQPGDLVFFNTLRRAYSHVGIYVGAGKFIHSPRSGAQVRIEDMRTPYWSQRYNGARRPVALAAASPMDTGNPTLPTTPAGDAAWTLSH